MSLYKVPGGILFSYQQHYWTHRKPHPAALLFGLVMLSSEALTEEYDFSPWAGNAGLGATLTTGNSETGNINAELKVIHETSRWIQRLLLRGIGASDQGEKTAERYVGDYKATYGRTEHRYAFGTLRAEQDRFGGFEYQISQTGGFGYRPVSSQRATLDLEGGLGFRQSKRTDDSTEDEIVARGSVEYLYAVSENAELAQDLLVLSPALPGGTNTQIQTVTELKVKMIEKVAVKLSFNVNHNTDVPPDTEQTDTITAVTLVYDF